MIRISNIFEYSLTHYLFHLLGLYFLASTMQLLRTSLSNLSSFAFSIFLASLHDNILDNDFVILLGVTWNLLVFSSRLFTWERMGNLLKALIFSTCSPPFQTAKSHRSEEWDS